MQCIKLKLVSNCKLYYVIDYAIVLKNIPVVIIRSLLVLVWMLVYKVYVLFMIYTAT